MANISHVTDRLLTGGDLPLHLGAGAMVAHLQDWVSAGITHVIDNRGEWNDAPFVARHAAHISYLHNGQDDVGQRMPDQWFDDGVDFALEAFRSPETRVLAHCHMGINRGPSLALAILLAQGVQPVPALAAIRSARPIAATGYATDALHWWHRRSATPAAVAARQRADVAAWLAHNPLDVVRIIRDIRVQERIVA
jgi:hypothetical protein